MKRRAKLKYAFLKAYKLSHLKNLSILEVIFGLYSCLSIPIMLVTDYLNDSLTGMLLVLNILVFSALVTEVFDQYVLKSHTYTSHHKRYYKLAIMAQCSIYSGILFSGMELNILSNLFIIMLMLSYFVLLAFTIIDISRYIFYVFLKYNFPVELEKSEDKKRPSKEQFSMRMTLQTQKAYFIISNFNGILLGGSLSYAYLFLLAKLKNIIEIDLAYDFLNYFFSGELLEYGIFISIAFGSFSVLSITYPGMLRMENTAIEEYSNGD